MKGAASHSCECAWYIVSSNTFYQIYGYSCPRRLCLFSAVLQKAVIQFSEAAPNLKKAGRCHVTTDLWSSGQSITCLSQHFGQLSNTNSFSLPSSQRSTIGKLASLCTRGFFKRPLVVTQRRGCFTNFGLWHTSKFLLWGYFLGDAGIDCAVQIVMLSGACRLG